MKKLLCLVMTVLMLFTACSSEPEEKYPPQKMDFGDGNYSWHYYDDQGMRTRYEVFSDDVLTEIHYFEHDADGNVTKNTITDAAGKETKRTETEYKNGLRRYEAMYHGDILVMEEWFSEDDRTTLSKSYDDNGQLKSWYESFYGTEDGDYSIFYRADGTVYQMQQYTEDENGRFVTVITHLDESENITKIIQQTSTANGFKEEVLFDANQQ